MPVAPYPLPHCLCGSTRTIKHPAGQGDTDPHQRKTFVIVHNPEPIFDLLGHFVVMVLHDGAFAADFTCLEDIYWHPIPSHQISMAYVFQQTFINKINNKVLVLVWDQVADHDSNAVKYYLDNVVHADIEVIAMELPPREAVQVMAYSLGLDADLVIWVMDYSSVAAAAGTPLYQEKMKIQTQLNSAKVGDNEDPAELTPPPPPTLQIKERRYIVELVCRSQSELTDEEIFQQCCASIILWVHLQGRKEPPSQGQHKWQCTVAVKSDEPDVAPQSPGPEVSFVVPWKLEKLECPFCVCDASLPMATRKQPWKDNNTFWNHVEKHVHQHKLKVYVSGRKECGICWKHGVVFIPVMLWSSRPICSMSTAEGFVSRWIWVM
ncbi:hypothetical protein D8B26_004669 [Coccidioides posadasii str. Silveira]|uniref:uncharacterized protein n=1 Tax=Coccidioides posadasii (strain RMSCC 757 / Silveira) TaxID=443226 RepID=UPI001BF1527D|nr:hypothetical protein D8B26_004669 [Coccidioides posadasii str. Silveira]